MNKNRKTTNKRKINKNSKSYFLTRQSNYSNRENAFITGIEPHKYVTLRYVETFSSSIITTVGTQQSMNLNSLFDPNRTGSGHQPMYFDQLAALYNRYRVLNTRYKVGFAPTTGSYNVVVLPVNGVLAASVSDASTYQSACECPRAVYKLVPGTGGYPVYISGRISLNDLNGCTRTEYLGDDRFEAAITTSPAEIMILAIGIYNPTAATIVVNYTIEMEFEVDFHDVISVGGS